LSQRPLIIEQIMGQTRIAGVEIRNDLSYSIPSRLSRSRYGKLVAQMAGENNLRH
jgi:hypothetical protein